MKQLNVVVIEQLTVFSKEIKELLLTHKVIKDVTTFANLDDGINKIFEDDVDIVLLDIDFPKYNEKLPIEMILTVKRVPVLVMAENTIFQTAKTIQAMIHGAVDFIKFDHKDKKSLLDKEKEIIRKITNAKKGKLQQSVKSSNINIETKQMRKQTNKFRKKIQMESIIVIGASTGGPRALQTVLQDIPNDFPAPILIVQHMPERFTKSLAKRLDNICNLPVKEAEHGEIVKKGTVYLAPGNYHMRVKKEGNSLYIDISEGEERLGHRPSVNHLFDSVATLHHIFKIAVVLTGMGRDGAEGVKRIKECQDDAIIIAESKETAIINGMPNAVIQTNYVSEILLLDEIGEALIEYIKNS